MIQRKQTLYLIVVIALYAALFFMDMAIADNRGKDFASEPVVMTLYSDKPLMILAGLVIAISLVSIFSFKRLALQLRMTVVNMVMALGFIIMEGYVIYQLYQLEGNKLILVAAFFPIVALIAAYLAFKGVSRDIFRLRSYNRMR